jgi:hypothetical protein
MESIETVSYQKTVIFICLRYCGLSGPVCREVIRHSWTEHETQIIAVQKIFNMMKTHPEIEWNWQHFVNIDGFSLKFIDQYPHLPWGWTILSQKPDIPLDFIERHINDAWDWESLSVNNICITPDFIERHLDKPWFWGHLLQYNPNISLEYVEAHLDRNWWFHWDSMMDTITKRTARQIQERLQKKC